MANGNPKVRIRMYRQGFGDCFLLTFNPEAPQPVHVLIDCGTKGSPATGVKIPKVVDDILTTTGNHIHLLIATHEHQDHVSGFRSQKAKFASCQIDEAWVAWTENRKDPDAKRFKQYTGDLSSSLRLASDEIRSQPAIVDDEFRAIESGVRRILGFRGEMPANDGLFGAGFAETIHEAMNLVTKRVKSPGGFREPGEVIERAWLPGVRFYVLGPPRCWDSLINEGTDSSPELYHLAAQMAGDLARSLEFARARTSLTEFRSAMAAEEREAFDATMPFDLGFRIETGEGEQRSTYLAAYDAEEEDWRRIDHEWIRGLEDLALQLDGATNNTSLVLAVEFIDDKRVLLLAADAQLGNWLSWQELTFTVKEADGTTRKVKADDLLNRTVFYKVGHHSSHNATINDHGLEDMTRPDLVAMIPVDGQFAEGQGWEIPACVLYKELVNKTRGRVLRSDTGWPVDSYRPESTSVQEWRDTQKDKNFTVEKLYIDYLLR